MGTGIGSEHEGVSISTFDDEMKDMLDSKLYTREWRLVGTEPPTTLTHDSTDTQHLSMCFYQEDETTEDNISNHTDIKPIVMKAQTTYDVEILPVHIQTLGYYYDYFTSYVSLQKGDCLINVCKDRQKSPCVDIPYCILVKPKHKNIQNSEDFTFINIRGEECIIFIPTRIVYNLLCNLGNIDITVPPSIHDGWAYNSSRVRMSSIFTCNEIPDTSWATGSRVRDISRYVSCTAVATATLTVSFVLSSVRGVSSFYHNRKLLDVVVHAIK